MFRLECGICSGSTPLRRAVVDVGTLRCSVCGATESIARSTDDAEVESEGGCPKCHAQLDRNATACGRCGLAVERFAEFEEEQQASLSEEILARWAIVDNAWDEPHAHETFAQECSQRGELSQAARLYRKERHREARRVVATRALERIGKMAGATLVATPSPRTVPPFAGIAVVLGVLFLLTAALGLHLFSRGKAARTSPEPSRSRPFPELERDSVKPSSQPHRR